MRRGKGKQKKEYLHFKKEALLIEKLKIHEEQGKAERDSKSELLYIIQNNI